MDEIRMVAMGTILDDLTLAPDQYKSTKDCYRSIWVILEDTFWNTVINDLYVYL